ncbi:MAG: 2'-5' RNA ligase family protein [Edaphobacter sp.]|uniref:2'-5' RNA ligase family protein n=1 Tax=Edaphobacter sp. TaxID=1934404 RepID=UPI0023A6C21A|nr:2'-5' RNA ligase family protein [Edaphobacter sp.]MDE1178650.1 2'-5' RNA ligase family protein [Edaphobacter sp.]
MNAPRSLPLLDSTFRPAKRSGVSLLFALLAALLLSTPAKAQTAAQGPLVAVDVLLEVDANIAARAKETNTRLRTAYPQGYGLDAAHTPHITLVQRFVPASRMDEARGAVARVFAEQNLAAMKLDVTGYIVGGWSGTAIVLYKVELTPELRRLESAIDRAIQPYAASGGTAEAFVRPPGGSISAQTVQWVEEFIPAHSGEHYEPHITLGLTTPEFAAKLKAEPFQPIAFRPASLSMYQLGDVGTAQKKLAGWAIR